VAGQNVRLHVGLAQALPVTAESVDVVLCHAALMLMVPVAPVVAELARVLRSGGELQRCCRFDLGKGSCLGRAGA
jgi:ubiquinone/menaquinone biosynthesis C-methylase UbiE